MRITMFIFAALLLASCSSMEVVLDNQDDYDVFPLAIQNEFFFRKRSVSLLHYTLLQKKSANHSTDFRLFGADVDVKVRGGVYAFKKQEEQYGTVEITARTTSADFGSLEITNEHNKVRVQKSGGASYEVKTEFSPPSSRNIVLTINDVAIGKVTFAAYSKKIWKHQYSPTIDVGFIMSVNNEEYGILIYEGKPTVYLKKGWQNQHMDTLIMYFLAVYENYIVLKNT